MLGGVFWSNIYRESELSLRFVKGECCWVKGLGDWGLNFKLSRWGAEAEDRIGPGDGKSRLDSFLLLLGSELRLLAGLWEKEKLVLTLPFPLLFALYKLLLPLLLLWGLGREIYNKNTKENIHTWCWCPNTLKQYIATSAPSKTAMECSSFRYERLFYII